MQLPSKQVFKIFNTSQLFSTIPFSKNLETEKYENFSTTKHCLNALLKKKDVKIENLEIEAFEILKENKKLSALLNKKDVKIENLENENDGLKSEVKKKQTKIRVYEKMVSDYDVRVSSLEKLSKDLMGSKTFSEVKKAKKIVVESSRLPPPPGFKKIPDPKPKKEKESMFPEIIEIDDDDHSDHDTMKMYSSKRRRVSSYDDDDDKCISVLRRENVSKKVTKDHKNANNDVKLPTMKSHLQSPFCGSSDSDSDD